MSAFFPNKTNLSFEDFRTIVIEDYTQITISREASMLCRQEVLQGNASFGVSGDGKELPQVVMGHYFSKGDFLSGYYRDQTFCLSKKIISVQDYFAQLYANVEPEEEPCSGGRQMNSHFSTPFLDKKGNWHDLRKRFNVPANMSQTAGQMPRSIGFAYTSKLFRSSASSKKLPKNKISDNGNEICFCTVGDGSTAEGHFLETVHTAAALEIPLAIFIWDDGYGISVRSKNYMAKGNILKALQGMENINDDKKSINMYTIHGWDYIDLHTKIQEGIAKVRQEHKPAIFHITELTQPLGHSSSGSHERYKTAKRLKWEKEFDCNAKMRAWIITNKIAEEGELLAIEKAAKAKALNAQQKAYNAYISPINQSASQASTILETTKKQLSNPKLTDTIDTIIERWTKLSPKHRFEILAPLRQLKLMALQQQVKLPAKLLSYIEHYSNDNNEKYTSHLYSQHKSAKTTKHIPPEYASNPKRVKGFEIINNYFDKLFNKNKFVFAFGEDVGEIGDVNQGFSNLQKKYGKHRVFDTSIRELTIVGQAIGMAMRGLRPIAEIQYIDYLLYGLEPLCDDVSTLHYRTLGTQSCPLIIRTRGHRLEGIWHAGSPIAMIAATLKGCMIGVPRNMTQAAGLYNALMDSNDPGIIIEPLNQYRVKEDLPANLLKMKIPFGLCEVCRKGKDITVVSYGSTFHIVQQAATLMHSHWGIDVEVIDIQTILPFDTENIILKSLKKTNRILFVDEDLNGGFTNTMLTEVIDARGGFYHLDATPTVLCAKANRTSYGRDGEYFSKPSLEDVMEHIWKVIKE